MKILVSWLGKMDIGKAEAGEVSPAGPIAQALAAGRYDRLLLLADWDKKTRDEFVTWLAGVVQPEVEVIPVNLSSPTNYVEIHKAASAALENITKKYKGRLNLTLLLSSGTPAMTAIWIILGRTKYPAKLIQTSPQKGVEIAEIPFEIAAEYIPILVRTADEKRKDASEEKAPADASFGDIIYRSKEMERVVGDAAKTTLRDLPVLIEGESGTGKELLARAIHNHSPRSECPFIVVNCGAIPAELVESEFFGHKKGAFTGAIADQKGAFESAHGGTLFLDEIGELPLRAQVTLLRALQEGEIKRIGESQPRSVDVRIIAATNRDLIAEVAEGRFREDLYYRITVAMFKLPALRDRRGDLGLLTDRLLEKVNDDAKGDPGYEHKKLSVGARNLILSHSWPGNVRELSNTLRRITWLVDGGLISKADMHRAIQPVVERSGGGDHILNLPISESVDLNEILRTVALHYLERAMKETGGNKVKAAKLVGLSNYQTLTNWLTKYGVELD